MHSMLIVKPPEIEALLADIGRPGLRRATASLAFSPSQLPMHSRSFQCKLHSDLHIYTWPPCRLTIFSLPTPILNLLEMHIQDASQA